LQERIILRIIDIINKQRGNGPERVVFKSVEDRDGKDVPVVRAGRISGGERNDDVEIVMPVNDVFETISFGISASADVKNPFAVFERLGLTNAGEEQGSDGKHMPVGIAEGTFIWSENVDGHKKPQHEALADDDIDCEIPPKKYWVNVNTANILKMADITEEEIKQAQQKKEMACAEALGVDYAKFQARSTGRSRTE
jgi:hypothetical protein